MPVTSSTGGAVPARIRQDRTYYLYPVVIATVLLGIITRFAVPHVAVALTPLGTAFVNLIKMMISSIIICTDVPDPVDAASP